MVFFCSAGLICAFVAHGNYIASIVPNCRHFLLKDGISSYWGEAAKLQKKLIAISFKAEMSRSNMGGGLPKAMDGLEVKAAVPKP